MANPRCMSDDGNTAVFVGTMLETGDGVALCDNCLVAWAAALLNVMTGVDPMPFIAAISDDVIDGELVDADDVPPSDMEIDTEPDPPRSNGGSGRSSRASRA